MIEHQKISERGRHRRASQGAMSIRAFCDTYDIGRTKVYVEINAGRLKARKAGTRTIIGDDDADGVVALLARNQTEFLSRGSDAQFAAPGANAESQAKSNIEPGEERRAKRSREFRLCIRARLNLRNLIRTKKEAPTQINSRN